MSEYNKIREVLKTMPKEQRLFRINSGMGWAGKLIKNSNGMVILQDARPLHAAPKGWYDICGWTETTITSEMVGHTAAIFTGIEIKVTGRLSKEQKGFRDILQRMGGIYRIIQ